MQPQEDKNVYAEQAETQATQGESGMATFGQDGGQASQPKPAAAAPVSLPKASPFKGIDLSYVTLAVLVLAGAAGLYWIKTECGPRAASASQVRAQSQIDTALVQLGNVNVNDERTQSLVEEIYYEAAQRQIPVEQLDANPFLLQLTPVLVDAAQQEQTDMTPDELAAARARAEAARKQKKLAEYVELLAQLELRSVIFKPDGSSSALINDFVLYQGETIQGWQIAEIRPNEIVLTRGEFSTVMRMPSN
jgi:hypothetical protein